MNTGHVCEQCGGPMVVAGRGMERDPDRPGKWRPSSTADIQCEAALDAWRREVVAACREIDERHDAHTKPVTVPWPPVKTP